MILVFLQNMIYVLIVKVLKLFQINIYKNHEILKKYTYTRYMK